MKRTAKGSTPRQMAYARKILNGDGRSKKDIAREVGFSPSVADNARHKIEKTEGFLNAVQLLSFESGELVTSIMAEFKARGFKKHTTDELNQTLSLMTNVWEKFDRRLNPPERQDHAAKGNLRQILLQHTEKKTVVLQESAQESASHPDPIEVDATDIDL